MTAHIQIPLQWSEKNIIWSVNAAKQKIKTSSDSPGGRRFCSAPPGIFFAPSSPRLTCYAVKGSVALLPAYAPLTAQVGEALGRYEDGSGGQAKREKRGEKQGIP